MKKIILFIITLSLSQNIFAKEDFRGINFSNNLNFDSVSNILEKKGFKKEDNYTFFVPRYESPLKSLIFFVNDKKVEKIQYQFQDYQREESIVSYLNKKYGNYTEIFNLDNGKKYYEWLLEDKYILFENDTNVNRYSILLLPYKIKVD